MKIKIAIITYCSLLLMVSCINDESTYGTLEIPQLSIAGSENTTMPIVNFNLGETCVIHPDISYQGGKEADLQYEWSIGTYKNETKGELEIIGHNKTLEYHFPEGGTYYAHLNVTDGRVGQSIDYQININRTFEKGYILVSNDEAGNGNLAFVKIMTPEEVEAGADQICMEHCIERMNEGMSVGKLINAIHGKITWPKVINRILVSEEEHCYFFDPNTFTIISALNYEDVYPGFKASRFMPDSYSPYAYDDTMDKFVHLELQYMFSYEYSYYQGQSFDGFFIYGYKLFGNNNSMPLFVKSPTSEVVYFYSGLGQFISTGDKLADENILTVFIGKVNPYTPPVYIISSSKADPTKFVLRTIASFSAVGTPNESIMKQEFVVDDHVAVPAAHTKFAPSFTYNRYYYPIENKIYVCLTTSENPFPNKDQFAIQYADNEIVTYLDVNADTEELYVATYDTTKKRGNFYIYDTKDVKTDNQGDITPKATFKNCADKITGILYKPSI